MRQHVRVETTTDSRQEALALASTAIEARLAACAQVNGPITSVYQWQGAIENDEEWLVVFKTAHDRLDDLVARLRAEHSYDVPEIIAVPIIGGNPAYLDWLRDETRESS
ncbi:divalent-cation tolerance protein CutA [Lipingzhangella sp. LS1_29]|uniref:Divalent-cation tolerance protein CutA n=1 Tax=Lipingzhangella rawalii TaxID=2055835 RepID=A0ABU2H9H6_9ACTN|nr:divalent-cation tolerance protein CutA [Lipingzhangella rawalii]MDS1271500.1 divalent-cation tolerance protein CutA [Lipingzhangella rawalii]